MRRLALLEAIATGQSLTTTYAKLAKRFKCTERAVREDWETRSAWLPTLLPLHTGNLEQFPNQSFVGVQYARQQFEELRKVALAAKRAILVPVHVMEDTVDAKTGKVLRTSKTGGKVQEIDAPDVRSAVEATRGFLDTVMGEAKIAGSLLAERLGRGGAAPLPLSPEEERRAIAAAKSVFGGPMPAIPMYAQRIDEEALAPVVSPGEIVGIEAKKETKAGQGQLDLLEDLLREERGER